MARVTPTFASSIRLFPAAPGLYLGEADPAYAHSGGRFGGWTAAALLRAGMMEEADRGDPLSLSILFTDAVIDGEIGISTRLLRSGGRLDFLTAELTQRDKVCAHAQMTFGVRRAGLAFTDPVMPDVPGPETIDAPRGPAHAPFGAQFEARWATPFPLEAPEGGPARSLFWMRHVSGWALDAPLLAAYADFAPPRVFYRTRRPQMSSTVSMTVHFHATAGEMEAVGHDFVLNEVCARRCEGGYFDHEVRLWSRSGVLLATSEQVAAFRG